MKIISRSSIEDIMFDFRTKLGKLSKEQNRILNEFLEKCEKIKKEEILTKIKNN